MWLIFLKKYICYYKHTLNDSFSIQKYLRKIIKNLVNRSVYEVFDQEMLQNKRWYETIIKRKAPNATCASRLSTGADVHNDILPNKKSECPYEHSDCVMTSPMIKTHRGAVLSTLSTRLYHFSDIYTICVVVSTIDIAGFAFIII